MSVDLLRWAGGSTTLVELGNTKNIESFVTNITFDSYTGFRVGPSGVMQGFEGTTDDTWDLSFGNWLVAGEVILYEFRATLQSGTLTSGTVNTWLSASLTREWKVARTSVGTNAASFLLEVRLATAGLVLDSCIVNLTATIQGS